MVGTSGMKSGLFENTKGAREEGERKTMFQFNVKYENTEGSKRRAVVYAEDLKAAEEKLRRMDPEFEYIDYVAAKEYPHWMN